MGCGELLPRAIFNLREDGVLALVDIFLDQVDSLGSPFPTLFYSKRYNSVTASLLLAFDYDMALLSEERVARIRAHVVLVSSNDTLEEFLSHYLS